MRMILHLLSSLSKIQLNRKHQSFYLRVMSTLILEKHSVFLSELITSASKEALWAFSDKGIKRNELCFWISKVDNIKNAD